MQGFPVRTMARTKLLAISTVYLAALMMSGCGPQPARPTEINSADIEGLQQARTTAFSAAFMRPGVDFTIYRGVIVNDVQLAFRTPDRAQNQFPLSQEQKDQFRDYLTQQFMLEFAELQNIKLVAEAGPDVLDLYVRVQDIFATVPGRQVGSMGRAAFALEAVAEATLVIELRDSESEEVLVRVFDQRAIEGVAMFQNNETITRWQDAERLLQRWASRTREGLDRLVSGEY
jgi:hypothetical protein